MTGESIEPAPPLPEALPVAQGEVDEGVVILGHAVYVPVSAQRSRAGMGVAGIEAELAEQSRARTAELQARQEIRADDAAQE